MVSRHLVDPQLAVMLDMPPAPPMTLEGLPRAREMSRALYGDPLRDREEPLRVTERRIPGPDGAPEIRVLVYEPTEVPAPRPAILHIHGGGYIFGSPDMSDPRNTRLALALGCVIVSVDYRLAPETPFPGPLEDCHAALSWLHGEAAALGVDPARIAVSGESAGGGLAAALCLLARDRGGPSICFQALTYPMIDDRTCTRPAHPYTGQFVWTPERNAFGWRALLGADPGVGVVSPYAAAARADDLTRLPPAFISVGALDLFLDEDMDYALRLTKAGVPTELHVYPGAYHAFQRATEALVTQASDRDHLAALRRALEG